MTARQDKIKALELELKGIDVELSTLRPQFRALVDRIAELEEQRSYLFIRINNERHVVFRSV